MAAALLVHACVLGLHDHLQRVVDAVRVAIGADADFGSVATAAATIGILWESREPLEARDIAALPALLQAAFERAIYLGGDASAPADDSLVVVEALSRLRELLVSTAGNALDGRLFWAMVTALHDRHHQALVRGAAAGLLYSAGLRSEVELGTNLEGHLTGLVPPREAVGYLRGLLHTAREAAWQQPAVLAVIDRLLREWGEAAFVASLPELRLAFAEMTPKETDRIAESVARLHGAEDLGPLVRYDLGEADVQAALALSQALREVLAHDGLADWLHP